MPHFAYYNENILSLFFCVWQVILAKLWLLDDIQRQNFQIKSAGKEHSLVQLIIANLRGFYEFPVILAVRVKFYLENYLKVAIWHFVSYIFDIILGQSFMNSGRVFIDRSIYLILGHFEILIANG